MKSGRLPCSSHLIAFVFAVAFPAGILTGCGSDHAARDTASEIDGDVAEDAAEDAPDGASDLSGNDTASDDADASVPDSGAETVDVVTADTPTDQGSTDLIPIRVTGSFRFDYMPTESDVAEKLLSIRADNARAAAANNCGRFGVVFVDRYQDQPQSFVTSLVLSEVDLAMPPDIESPTPRTTLFSEPATTNPTEITASVAYDDCVPIVFMKGETGYTFTRVEGGAVQWNPVDSVNTFSNIEHHGAFAGRDDKIHLVFRARPSGGIFQWVVSTWNGTSFDTALLGSADTALEKVIDVAVSGAGKLIVGYTRSAETGSEVWVARYNGTGWDRERIPDATPSDLGLSFAVGSYDRESVVWPQVVTTEDGKILSSSLKYTYRDSDDSFKTETLAVENDGYMGGAGKRMTGAWPRLFIDRSGRPHVLFSDLAVTVTGTKQTVTPGQVRYGWRKNGTWRMSTIFVQESPTEQVFPGVAFKGIGTTNDGARAGIAAVSVTTGPATTVKLDTLGWSIVNED